MDGQHITNQVYHYTESIFFIMKNTLIIFFALLIMGKAMAQANHLDVNLSHNWNYLDRDVELAAERLVNKNGIRISLHYFQNTADESENWQNKPRATNFAERWGWSIAYLRYLPIRESNIELYPYLKLTGFYLPYQTKDEVTGLHTEPARWKLYSALGLQMKSRLYRNFYLSATVDAGAGWEKSNYSLPTDYFAGLATGGSVGLAYRIK